MSARSALRPPKSPGRRPSGCMPPPRDQARPTVRWARSHCALPSTSATSQCRGATRSTGSAGPRGRYRRAPRARLLRPRRPAQGASRCYSPRRRLLRRRCLKKMSSGQRKCSRRASMCSTHARTRAVRTAPMRCSTKPAHGRRGACRGWPGCMEAGCASTNAATLHEVNDGTPRWL